MKSIALIGVGMSLDTTTQEGYATIQNAEVLLGALRLLELFSFFEKPAFPDYLPEGVLRVLTETSAERYAILLSGDVGFFSAANALLPALKSYSVRLIPGISCLSYFFARLARHWQEAAIISCHARESNLVDTVRRSKLTFALTGGNLPMLSSQLEQAGFGKLLATIGENLGAKEERIQTMEISELSRSAFSQLSVLLIENPDADARVRFGIPDETFERGDVPMTKAEVRAFTLSRLSIMPDAVCCDIGCGTGSVSVEMAFAAYQGHVYAIDQSAEAIRLTLANAKRFHIGNLTAICARAPEALCDLPALDAVFIGGSGGQMEEIFDLVLQKNPRAQIVVNAIALESALSAIASFQSRNIEPEVVQLSAARARTLKGLHLMTAQNPIWIISGGGYV